MSISITSPLRKSPIGPPTAASGLTWPIDAPAVPPEAHELGWKDTVQCPDGMITRIIVRFEGYPGKYLYHCHILEHEANDMMRPYDIVA